MKFFLALFFLIPLFVNGQSTKYYANGSETSSTICNHNVEEITDLRVEFEVPEIGYQYDLITIDLYEVFSDRIRRADDRSSWQSSSFEYSGLTLRTATKTSRVLSKNILSRNGENLRGDFAYLDRKDILENNTDTSTFYLGIYGYEITGYKEKYDQGSRSVIKTPIYSGGTLLNDRVDLKVVQQSGWREKQRKREKEAEEAEVEAKKKERRRKILTWGGLGTVFLVVFLVVYFG